MVNEPEPQDPTSPAQYMAKVANMYSLVRLAFETDSTRTVTLMLEPYASVRNGPHRGPGPLHGRGSRDPGGMLKWLPSMRADGLSVAAPFTRHGSLPCMPLLPYLA